MNLYPIMLININAESKIVSWGTYQRGINIEIPAKIAGIK